MREKGRNAGPGSAVPPLGRTVIAERGLSALRRASSSVSRLSDYSARTNFTSRSDVCGSETKNLTRRLRARSRRRSPKLAPGKFALSERHPGFRSTCEAALGEGMLGGGLGDRNNLQTRFGRALACPLKRSASISESGCGSPILIECAECFGTLDLILLVLGKVEKESSDGLSLRGRKQTELVAPIIVEVDDGKI